MNFEYVGHRPVISQHGISFKKGKDDKYVYLPYAYEILDAINSDYESNKTHSSSIKIEKANIEKLFKVVETFYPTLAEDIETRLDTYKNQLEEKIEEIRKRETLNDVDKNIYLSNLESMNSYRINRAKNKIFYYFSIFTIVDVIKKNKIKKINLPFNEKFWHVLKTIQGVLASEKISSNIKAEQDSDGFVLKFTTSLY